VLEKDAGVKLVDDALAHGGPFGHQEPIRGDAQGGVMVKPAPVAAFIVSQAQFLLRFLVIPFK
jgi:hypothetical protein